MRNKGAYFKFKTLRFSITKNREVQNENKANKNNVFGVQFDSYYDERKECFVTKSIFLVANERALVREHVLCYFSKSILFVSFLVVLVPIWGCKVEYKTSKSIKKISRIKPISTF